MAFGLARKGLYRGYSSFEFQENNTFKLRDVELVKSDLLNHIFTRPGERVMMPSFGTQIPDLVFEPLDETTVEILEDELLFVVDYDPRVELVDLNIIPFFDQSRVEAHLKLLYLELNIIEGFNLNIQFDQ